MAEEVKLLGFWASPFSCRVKLTLKLKGVQYEYIEEDLMNKSDFLLKSNPVHKKIPVLVHNGKPIAESIVILEYIEETWKNNPILPKDPYSGALARFWAKFVDEKILPTAVKTKTAKGLELEKLVEELNGNLKFLEDELTGKEFFGGESIGYLDIVAFVRVHWIQLLLQEILKVEFITEEKVPALHEWLGKLRELDLVKECLPPTDKHAALMKASVESANSAPK